MPAAQSLVCRTICSPMDHDTAVLITQWRWQSLFEWTIPDDKEGHDCLASPWHMRKCCVWRRCACAAGWYLCVDCRSALVSCRAPRYALCDSSRSRGARKSCSEPRVRRANDIALATEVADAFIRRAEPAEAPAEKILRGNLGIRVDQRDGQVTMLAQQTP